MAASTCRMYSICARCGFRRAGLIAVLCALLAACGDSGTPQERIRTLVSAMQAAVERGSLGDAAELLAKDYRDEVHADKKAALRSLFVYLRRNQNIHLFVRVSEIRLDEGGQHAQLLAYVAMTAKPVESAQALIPLKADLYRFDVKLQLDDGEWRFASARWRPALLSDLGV